MVNKKTSKDKHKEKQLKEMQARKVKEQEDLPMNAGFLSARNDDGTFKFSSAEKVWNYKLNPEFEDVQKVMRVIASTIQNIRHSITAESLYKDQLADGEIYSKDQQGHVMTRGQVINEVWFEKLRRYGFVHDVRFNLVEKLVPMIGNGVFTAEMYDDYFQKIEENIKSFGYELFPKNLEIILPA